MLESKLLSQRITELGFNSTLELFRENPNVSFGHILRLVGKPVEGKNYLDIPILVLKLSYAVEAKKAGNLKEFAKDCLIRSFVEHVKQGWGIGKDWKRRSANVFANWFTPEGEDEMYTKVWNKIVATPPPIGWRPSSIYDEIISKAFDEVWPASGVKITNRE
jgi:hypothetical protein